MTLSAAEIAVYTANASGDRLVEGVTLTHPRFDIPVNLTPEPESWIGDDGDGLPVIYQPAPLAVTHPGQDASGLGTLPIRFMAIPAVVRQLRLASSLSTAAVRMTLRTYVAGNPEPVSVRRFQLTGARVGGGIVSATASIAAAIEGVRWGRGTYRIEFFPGLDRS